MYFISPTPSDLHNVWLNITSTYSIIMTWIFSIIMFWILLPIIKLRRNFIISRCITFTPATSFFGYVTLLYYVNAPNSIISIHFNKKFGIKSCADILKKVNASKFAFFIAISLKLYFRVILTLKKFSFRVYLDLKVNGTGY